MWSESVIQVWIEDELKTNGSYSHAYPPLYVMHVVERAMKAVRDSYEQKAKDESKFEPLDHCPCEFCQKAKMEQWLSAVDEACEEVEEETDDAVTLVLSPGTVLRISVEK